MKTKITTVTVGIPAHNEEKNIGKLLKSVLNQTQSVFRLDKIIIASDGSTDDTVKIVNNIKNPLISVIDDSERKGKSYKLNQIINNTNSDVLVILDADILIQDKLFADKLIKPIIESEADLTSAAIEELEPKTFIQKILKASMLLKKNIFENFKGGNNLYTCHGRARAFSRKLYSSINFEDTIADDAFSYLFCKANNFKYFFIKEAKVFYKLPETLEDHEKQSTRFFKSLKILSYKFKHEDLKSEYNIPYKLSITVLLKFALKYPIILLYFPIVLQNKIKSAFVNFHSTKWEIAKSSKLIDPTI